MASMTISKEGIHLDGTLSSRKELIWFVNLLEKVNEATFSSELTYDVVITSCGDRKINVIKAIRELISCDLKTAKDLSESASGFVVRDTGIEIAHAAATRLRGEGARVDVIMHRADFSPAMQTP